MIARLLKFPSRPDREPDENVGSDKSDKAGLHAGLTAQEREFLPSLLEIQESPPPSYQRLLVWTLTALVAVALLWSAFGHLDVVSTAPGRFIPDGRVKVMQVTETAIVKVIHVKEGQQVKQGDLLLELDPTLTDADLTASHSALQHSDLDAARLTAELSGATAQYDHRASPTEISLEETLRRANEAAYQSKLAGARAQLAEKKAALAAATITLHKLATLKDIALEKSTDSQALLDEHFLSRVEYLKDYQGWVSADQDYAAQLPTVEQAQQAVQQATQQLTQAEQEHRADILKDLNHNITGRPELQNHLDRAQQLNALKWLRAPVSGYVQAVAVSTTGGVVTPAQNLVTIVPEGTPLIVEASLLNDDIGYVKVGQPVELKVDTYPFQKYGTLKGTLSWISPDAEQPKDPNSANASADHPDNGDLKPEAPATSKTALTYRVHVTVNPGEHLMLDGHPAPLKPGMSIQADIETERRKIYEFFLAPLVKYLDEGTHVR